MNKKVLFIMMLVLALALVACGGGDSDSSDSSGDAGDGVGNAANGEALFKQTTIGSASAPGCITCHSLEPDVVLVGPSQAGLEVRAETRVAGQSAEDYIRNSIVNPNDYIVDGFTADVMYQNYGAELTEKEINDIVAYTLTLK